MRQNLVLHARLFQVPEAEIPARVDEMVDALRSDGSARRPARQPAAGHAPAPVAGGGDGAQPELLILDEPTSGVDPIARDAFWQLMIDLSRNDQVTIFISTHFMNEAERCDRISLMHAGRVLVSDTPAATGAHSAAPEPLEAGLHRLSGGADRGTKQTPSPHRGGSRRGPTAPSAQPDRAAGAAVASVLGRAFSYSLRETLELRRDPVRATMALLGTADPDVRSSATASAWTSRT